MSDLSGTCVVCKDFLEKDYKVYDIQTKCRMMMEAVEQHNTHMKQAHSAKRKCYAFTFTTNLDTQIEIQKEMCYAAWKLLSQKTVPVLKGEVYLEYTEKKRPHLHGWYETEDGGRIFAKVFQRCWKYWGEKARQTKFAGGFHEEMRTNRYIAYASAEARLVCIKMPGQDARYEPVADTWWPDIDAYIEPEIKDADKV